jgi:hypothetical protein
MPSRSSCGRRSGEFRMTFRPARMIRHPADGGPRMRMAVQDAWTAIGPARAIIQDRWMTLQTAIRVARRALAAWTASRRTAR